jgi:hypothetical protein
MSYACDQKFPPTDWAIGGKPLSTADVQALGATRPVKVG